MLKTFRLQRWSVLVWLMASICSVIPFGFVVLDVRLKREMTQLSAAG